jgi:hypothetical protein
MIVPSHASDMKRQSHGTVTWRAHPPFWRMFACPVQRVTELRGTLSFLVVNVLNLARQWSLAVSGGILGGDS